MRRVLVDFARARLTSSRGQGAVQDSIDDHYSLRATGLPDPDAVIEMGRLMDRLQVVNPQWAMIVDMHYFVGFTLEEIADKVGLTRRQVKHLWGKASDWLKDQMQA